MICSPKQNILRVIKSGRMRGVGHVARVGERSVYRVLVANLREIDHFKDPGIDGRIIVS